MLVRQGARPRTVATARAPTSWDRREWPANRRRSSTSTGRGSPAGSRAGQSQEHATGAIGPAASPSAAAVRGWDRRDRQFVAGRSRPPAPGRGAAPRARSAWLRARARRPRRPSAPSISRPPREPRLRPRRTQGARPLVFQEPCANRHRPQGAGYSAGEPGNERRDAGEVFVQDGFVERTRSLEQRPHAAMDRTRDQNAVRIDLVAPLPLERIERRADPRERRGELGHRRAIFEGRAFSIRRIRQRMRVAGWRPLLPAEVTHVAFAHQLPLTVTGADTPFGRVVAHTAFQ